jgi:translation initiation factor IF-1
MKLVRLIPGEKVVVKLGDVDPSRGRIIRRFVADGETKR